MTAHAWLQSSSVLACLVTSITAALVCVVIHYEVLRGLFNSAPRLSVAPRHRILYVVIGALFAHFVEIGVFSVAFFWLSASAKSFFEPHFSDLREGGERLLEAFLLSIESYSSLGMTALHASRELRLVSGIESLTGLLLIGWTTAYTFLAMTEFWKDH